MRDDDLDAIAALLGDPAVMAHYPRPRTREEAQQWIDRNRQRYAEHGFGLWVVETRTGEFVGDCGLTWQTVDDRPMLEVGYHVVPALQGRGYAAEAAVACRDRARERGWSDVLVAIIHRDNAASIRVAERIGMTLDPVRRHASAEHVVYSLTL